MKNSSFARFARAFFIFVNFTAVFVVPRFEMNGFVVWTTGEVQGKVSFFSLVISKPHNQFNPRRVRMYFTSAATWNSRKMTAETGRYMFRWRSRCRQRDSNEELKQSQRLRQRKRHLKIIIWEMVTIFWLLLLPRILYCWQSALQLDW